jgi:hypothetical protein
MPRYFFILVYPDRIIGDPRGTVVPSDEAAIGAAREIIDELLEDCGPGQPRPLDSPPSLVAKFVLQVYGSPPLCFPEGLCTGQA